MNFENYDDTCCRSWTDYPGPSWSLTKTCLHQGVLTMGSPAEIISLTSTGVRPGITQRKSAKQRPRKQSPWLTAFSSPSTRRNIWCFPVSFLWAFSGPMLASIFLHWICRFRYFWMKILVSFYGCFYRNQILGFLSYFPKSATSSPSTYRLENFFYKRVSLQLENA